MLEFGAEKSFDRLASDESFLIIIISIYYLFGVRFRVFLTGLFFWEYPVVLAVCPNNNEVHIYQASPSPTSAWECIHVLQKVSLHILLVLLPHGEQCIHFLFLEFFWEKAHKPTDN